ncbi:MAG: 50S ribosomal protein L9 [bacterium]|nr:50S ribosomal protein L9 [Acidimicrobiia bacterium]MCY4648873.1 50S ribosomal protein L9 [bacterium]
MSARLILTEDIAGLGYKGEVVEVAPGYARNYLIPRRKAVKATPKAIAHIQALKQAKLAEYLRRKTQAEQVATRLVGKMVVIAARASDAGNLYGSVGSKDVVEAVRRDTGFQLEPTHVVLEAPIRKIGAFPVTIRPHEDVQFPITVDVYPAEDD